MTDPPWTIPRPHLWVLTAAQRHEARQAYVNGATLDELAERYGVARAVIVRALTGQK